MRQITAVVAALMLIAYASAQSDVPATDLELGRFSVSAAGDSAVLLDTKTGDTWLLSHHPTSDRISPVWTPIQRLDSDDDFELWREQEDKRLHLLRQLEEQRILEESYRKLTSDEDQLREIRERIAESEAQLNSLP